MTERMLLSGKRLPENSEDPLFFEPRNRWLQGTALACATKALTLLNNMSAWCVESNVKLTMLVSHLFNSVQPTYKFTSQVWITLGSPLLFIGIVITGWKVYVCSMPLPIRHGGSPTRRCLDLKRCPKIVLTLPNLLGQVGIPGESRIVGI